MAKKKVLRKKVAKKRPAAAPVVLTPRDKKTLGSLHGLAGKVVVAADYGGYHLPPVA